MDRRGTDPSRAFTLIELLVVVAVVAILAALLLPVLSSVHENGNATQCASNLRQIASALNLYTQDHANALPQRMYGYDAQGQAIGYPERILQYIDTGGTPAQSVLAKKIYTCPSQASANYPAEPGYGMNWYYDNTNLGVVSQPVQTILLTETAGQSGTGSRRADRDNTGDDIGKLDPTRHRGKANYLFFDGHISRLAYAETRLVPSVSPDNPPTDLWGTDHGDHTEPIPGSP